MHARTRITATVLSAPVAFAVVAGPLAGAAVADPPTPVSGTFKVERGSVLQYPITTERHGQIVVTTFTERSVDAGPEFPGKSVTTWTCAKRDGTFVSRCTGDGVFTGTYGMVGGTADVRLTATCTDDGRTPLFVTCEGRFRLDGRGALDGLRGQATWTSAGLFGSTVTGTSELRLHDHR